MKLDALRCNVELDSILGKSLNILDLHNGSDQSGDMAALLRCYELEVLETDLKASQDCRSLVRVLNRILRNKKTRQESDRP